MIHLAILPLLAHVAELSGEWTLLDDPVPHEHVSLRATYLRAEGRDALLPREVQRPQRPTVYLLGARDPLPVTLGREGWQARLPDDAPSHPRLWIQVTRAIDMPWLFRAAWPRTATEDVPVRRVAIVPRRVFTEAPPDWTCPAEPEATVPCVSRALSPAALVTRMAPPRSSTGARLMAVLVLTATAMATVASPRERAQRVLAAGGGAVVGASLALALVGACVCTWAVGLALMVPPGALVGALAHTHRGSRVAGTAALAVMPLMAVTGIALPALLAVAVLAVLGVMLPWSSVGDGPTLRA